MLPFARQGCEEIPGLRAKEALLWERRRRRWSKVRDGLVGDRRSPPGIPDSSVLWKVLRETPPPSPSPGGEECRPGNLSIVSRREKPRRFRQDSFCCDTHSASFSSTFRPPPPALAELGRNPPFTPPYRDLPPSLPPLPPRSLLVSSCSFLPSSCRKLDLIWWLSGLEARGR